MFQLLGGPELGAQVCPVLTPQSPREVLDTLDALLGPLGLGMRLRVGLEAAFVTSL